MIHIEEALAYHHTLIQQFGGSDGILIFILRQEVQEAAHQVFDLRLGVYPGLPGHPRLA